MEHDLGMWNHTTASRHVDVSTNLLACGSVMACGSKYISACSLVLACGNEPLMWEHIAHHPICSQEVGSFYGMG